MRLLLPGAIALVAGCGGAAQTRLETLRHTTALARERGAYRCAPVALARADARANFADLELAAGELIRAEAQLDLGERAAALALRDAQSCLNVFSPIVAPPPSLRKADRDHDGVLDSDDHCPDEPEDHDGYKDEDGCPDPDNDAVGVLDADDRCPNQAGPAAAHGCPDRDGDGIADADDRCPDVPGVAEEAGCPAPKLIVVQKDKIELKQKIHFATGKSTILPDSTPLLTEIAAALAKRPTVRVRIEGHTDARGAAAINTRLSRARAEAVRSWLITAGIVATRLVAVGFGPSQPIADNRTASGREENRRVEFLLLGEEP
jgi:outer membrane protein OmpA-like peptidoglycan-associated protein